jgi:ABC-type transport system involved in multi-copper enzyme maturation permease subunit
VRHRYGCRVNRVYAITLNAYREAIRDRVLFGVLALAAASLLFGSSIAWLSLAEQVRILVDHGVVTISWLSNLVAIFLGASFLYKEIELRTLYVILAKPVARWQFVLGKYLGILTTTFVFITLTASLLLVLLDLQAAEAAGPSGAGFAWLSRQVLASRRARLFVLLALAVFALGLWQAGIRSGRVRRVRDALGAAITVLLAVAALAVSAAMARAVAAEETRYVLVSCVLVVGEVTITAAVATLFSSFSTPFVTGVLTFGTFLVGRSAGAMMELRGRQLPPEIRDAIKHVAAIVPNLQLYVPSRDALEVREVGLSVGRYLVNVSGYALLYASVLLVVAALLFRRRDLV